MIYRRNRGMFEGAFAALFSLGCAVFAVVLSIVVTALPFVILIWAAIWFAKEIGLF